MRKIHGVVACVGLFIGVCLFCAVVSGVSRGLHNPPLAIQVNLAAKAIGLAVLVVGFGYIRHRLSK